VVGKGQVKPDGFNKTTEEACCEKEGNPESILGLIPPTFYEQLLHPQIPKLQKR